VKRILDYLPPLYDGILPEVFSRRIPAESLATCTDCAMCRRPGEPKAPAVRYFQPDARCCTYYPSLPNYLAGALLAEDSSALREGRERLRALLRAGEGAAPMVLGATPGYERRYGRLGDRGFGRWHGLLCPYFRSGPNDCAVWRFRNSVCATYFCRHAMGIPGAGFWRAVQRYLGVIEESLAAHALRRLGWPPERTRAFSVVYRNWEQVYRGAHDIVRGLSPWAVERIGGSAAQTALDGVKESLRRMLSRRLPGRLRLNPGLRVRRREDRVYLEVPGHISHCLHRPVWSAVQSFDARFVVEEVTEELRREHGLELSRGFLLALYRSGILLEGAG